jgi:hypothetical protein
MIEEELTPFGIIDYGMDEDLPNEETVGGPFLGYYPDLSS